MATRLQPPPDDRYLTDPDAWALEQAALLRARRFGELDLENLAEEVEDLGRRKADELESRYATLLQHLLEWEFHPARRFNSWAGTIGRSRRKIVEHVDDNPGLKSRRVELFSKTYPDGRDDAAIETNLPREHFPAENPYTLEQVMDEDFWPGGREMPDHETTKRRRR